MLPAKLASLFQQAENALEAIFHTVQNGVLLGPMWRDLGRIIGRKRLEAAQAIITPRWLQGSFSNTLPWHMLLAGLMVAKPAFDLGHFAYAHWQPPLKPQAKEQILEKKEPTPAQNASLYFGAFTLAAYATLNRKKKKGSIAKVVQVTAGAGHLFAESALLLANLASIVGQPGISTMLPHLWGAAACQITESLSDITISGLGSHIAASFANIIPIDNPSFKRNAELALSIMLSVAGTYAINHLAVSLTPAIAFGLTAAWIGYPTIKMACVLQQKIRKLPFPLLTQPRPALSNYKNGVRRPINLSLLYSFSATAALIVCSVSFFTPPVQAPASGQTTTPQTVTPSQEQQLKRFYTSPHGQQYRQCRHPQPTYYEPILNPRLRPVLPCLLAQQGLHPG